MKLVTVFSSVFVVDVQLAKCVLDGEGIQSSITDYYIASIAPHYIPALSGIKLNVKEQDYQEAKKILDDYMGKIQKPANKKAENTVNKMKCPKCGSENVIKTGASKIWGLVIMAFGFMDGVLREPYLKCRDCGYKVKIKNI
ncbi:DUF2007 domain-containing protein [bacterium]|nr:hypothetical protein [bacterium]MBU3956486.1 DUF2007 domain-containing protein [bacterium]